MAHVNIELDAGAWGSYWQKRPMPILEASRNALQHMLRRADRVLADDVAQVVLGDPLLTLQALRMMSMRPRSSLSAEVVSIQSIVMLMGTTPFLEKFCNLPTVESLLLPGSPADYTVYLQHVFMSRFAARLALTYADWRYEARMDEIHTSAILSRCNALLQLVGARMDKQTPPLAGESYHLLAKLRLPEALVQLLGVTDNAPPRVSLQLSTLRLAGAISSGWWQQEVQQELALIASMLNKETGTVWSALCRVALYFARDPERWPQIEQPARWLPLLPGEWPVVATRKSAEPAPQNNEKIQPDPLAKLMQSLHLSGKPGTPSKDIMALTMRALSEGLEMRRIVFALLAPKQAELCARFVMGVGKDDPLRQMVIRIDVPNLFFKLLEKPQSFWFNDTNATQYARLLPAEFCTCFVSEHFFVMSIFVSNKPLGLIVVDRNGVDALSEYQYQHFKQICLLTTRALTQSAGR